MRNLVLTWLLNSSQRDPKASKLSLQTLNLKSNSSSPTPTTQSSRTLSTLDPPTSRLSIKASSKSTWSNRQLQVPFLVEYQPRSLTEVVRLWAQGSKAVPSQLARIPLRTLPGTKVKETTRILFKGIRKLPRPLSRLEEEEPTMRVQPTFIQSQMLSRMSATLSKSWSRSMTWKRRKLWL